MKFDEIIKSKIERLINIRMTVGVQPNDLANNIFDDAYKNINFKKINDNVIAELNFEENIENKVCNTTLKYTYDRNMRVMRIEEIINGNAKIEWDRDLIENELLQDIVNILKNEYSDEKSKEFINTLPNDLKTKIEGACTEVA